MNEKVITYNLSGEQVFSKSCYDTLEALAKKLQADMDEFLGEELEDYRTYIKEIKAEPVRQSLEYGIELLLLGISFRWYEAEIGKSGTTSLASMIEAVDYFEKSGEFKEELIRFNQWMGYFYKCGQEKSLYLWNKAAKIISKIDDMGRAELDRYLPCVESFIEQKRALKKQRKDMALLLRNKSFYYINMIGAQLLNSIYREEFLRAEDYFIFLPGCMAAGGSMCRAEKCSNGYKCAHCTSDCEISKISDCYMDLGIGVRIIYHESEIAPIDNDTQGKIGIVGVACVLNLLSGGFKARRLGFVPQCVYLDYCGCSQHWSQEGIVTSVDREQLYKLLKKTKKAPAKAGASQSINNRS